MQTSQPAYNMHEPVTLNVHAKPCHRTFSLCLLVAQTPLHIQKSIAHLRKGHSTFKRPQHIQPFASPGRAQAGNPKLRPHLAQAPSFPESSLTLCSPLILAARCALALQPDQST